MSRASKIHCLKCWPEVFEDTRLGRKQFEFRFHDRDYAVGDVLVLQEYNPELDSLSGECCAVRVTYLMLGGKYGVPATHCVMGVELWPSQQSSTDGGSK